MTPEQAQWFAGTFSTLVASVEQAVVGKQHVVRLAVTCLLSEGHLLLEDFPGTGKTSLAKALANQAQTLEGDTFTTIHGPRWRLFIIGAGQLSRFVAQVAAAMDYAVIVCDPREEYREGWNVAGARLVHVMPDDLVLEAKLDQRSAVIALTHDPKLDDLALMEALRSEAFYVGAIGSRANNAKRRERLRLFDLSEAQVARLHAPIGLYIASKTPAEIAISILAELTAVKNAVPAGLRAQHAGAAP